MSQKTAPFSRKELEEIISVYPTPFHIYLEKEIKKNARRLLDAFTWAEGFKEFFAVKATPNPYLMKILGSEVFP